MGQEVPIQGYSDPMAIAGTSVYQQGLNANLTDVNGAAVTGAPVNQAQTARRVVDVLTGPQTPQQTQPA